MSIAGVGQTGRARLARACVALVVLAGLVGPVTRPTDVAAQRSEEVTDVDLAAMTLTPADLDDAGLEDYGIGYGETIYLDTIVEAVAATQGRPVAEVREVLEEAGLSRVYYSYLYLPEEPGDPASPTARYVFSYAWAFADEAGAAAAWDLLEDESSVEEARDLPEAEELGDQSELTSYPLEDPATGDQSPALDFSFRLGNLSAGVTIVDLSGEEPDVAEAEALAERLLERVETVLDEGAPGLGNRVLRLTGEAVGTSEDYYLLLDGEAIPRYGDAPGQATEREDAAADVGQTQEYRLSQWIPWRGDEAVAIEDYVWFQVSLVSFEDEAAAADWLAGSEERFEDNETWAAVEVDDDAPTFGDESVVFLLEAANSDLRYRSVSLRVGEVVALIDVIGPEPPPAAVAEVLAEAQVACLEDGACLEPMAVPEELAAFVADLGEADDGADDADGAGAVGRHADAVGEGDADDQDDGQADGQADDQDDGQADDDETTGDLDGRWEGETEDGQPFSFVVEEGGVASVSFAYECDGEPVFAGVAISPPAPIEDGQFVFESETSGGTTTVIGSIAADGSAEGTTEVVSTDDDCDVSFTWTAEPA